MKDKKQNLLYITVLVVAVIITYCRVLHAPFCPWDDDEYVFNNKDIHALGIQNIRMWCSNFYVGNFAPLTMLTYALDFALGGNDPFYYHLTNIIFHILNTTVLYLFIIKIQNNRTVALFTALLFALAPVQAEGVSWISERKTLLCTFFYLLALIQYTGYVRQQKKWQLILILLLAVTAMLSKAIAVAVPVSLFVVDIWLRRSLNSWRPWLEKIPLFAIAVLIGLTAIKAEAADQFLNTHPEINIGKSIALSGYIYINYIVHIVAPAHLSLYYPYPSAIGIIHFIYLLFTLVVGIMFFLCWKKKWTILCGSILFYTANIVLVMQFVQFSYFLMADHYSYIASIGIFFPVVYYGFYWSHTHGKNIIAFAVAILFSGVFLLTTFKQNRIWLSEIDFARSLLNDFPSSAVAQYTMGTIYVNNGDYLQAGKHFDKAVLLNPNDHKAWYNKGALLLRQGKTVEALAAMNRSLEIDPCPQTYFSRAILYLGTRRTSLALADVEKVLEIQPANARAWYIKGNCLEQFGSTSQAIDCYSSAISYENDEPMFCMRRGKALADIGQYRAALDDLNNALSLNPDYGEALYYRGAVLYNLGQSPCNDFKTAMNKGYKVPVNVMNTLCNN